jgi:carbon catabolite-derepressing protein kinase
MQKRSLTPVNLQTQRV